MYSLEQRGSKFDDLMTAIVVGSLAVLVIGGLASLAVIAATGGRGRFFGVVALIMLGGAIIKIFRGITAKRVKRVTEKYAIRVDRSQ